MVIKQPFFVKLLTAIWLPAIFYASAGDIHLSEVVFFPRGERPVMIELENTSSAPVDLAGYLLVDQNDFIYEFPASSVIAGNGLAVVVFGFPEEEKGNDTVLWLYCTQKGYEKAFRNWTEQSCRLYSPSSTDRQLGELIDKVCWIAKNSDTPEPYCFNMLFHGYFVGGNLARYRNRKTGEYSNWYMTSEDDQSIGETNPIPRPLSVNSFKGQSVLVSPSELDHVRITIPLRWKYGAFKLKDDGFFRLQVAEDPLFKKMMKEEKINIPEYIFKTAPVCFYWRVRYENASGVSEWSKADYWNTSVYLTDHPDYVGYEVEK